MKLMLAEDEPGLSRALTAILQHSDYEVDTALDGLTALENLLTNDYDAAILDIMMPGMDGIEVLKRTRAAGKRLPIIMLTAKSEVSDKVEGLDAGANDYLTKPFHLEELEARIRSLTRRRFTQNNVVLNCGKVAFDTKARVAVANGQELSLTRKEIGILEYLLLNQGRPVSQEELLDHVWDNSVDNFSNSIRVHISALRKKLRAALGYDPIRNRIGEGYVMEEEKV